MKIQGLNPSYFPTANSLQVDSRNIFTQNSHSSIITTQSSCIADFFVSIWNFLYRLFCCKFSKTTKTLDPVIFEKVVAAFNKNLDGVLRQYEPEPASSKLFVSILINEKTTVLTAVSYTELNQTFKKILSQTDSSQVTDFSTKICLVAFQTGSPNLIVDTYKKELGFKFVNDDFHMSASASELTDVSLNSEEDLNRFVQNLGIYLDQPFTSNPFQEIYSQIKI